MTTQSEIMALERKFWQSMVDGDVDAAVSFLDEFSSMTAVRGIHHFTPAEYSKMALSEDVRITSFKFFDEKVIFPTPEVAVATYKAKQAFTMGGKSHEMTVFDTTTWVMKAGKWLACAHTETPAQDGQLSSS